MITIVYMPHLDEPELMIRMCDYVETDLQGVLRSCSRSRKAPRWQADLESVKPTAKYDYRCAPYRHRECAICGDCWRHGACVCGPSLGGAGS